MSAKCAAGCDRPASAVLCRPCTRRLTAALREIATGGIERKRVHAVGRDQITLVDYRPGLAAELDATMARWSNGAGMLATRGAPAEPELPYHAAAAALVHELRNTITTWARVLLDEHPTLPGPRGTSTAAVAGWLSTQPTALAMLAAAAELHAEILALRKRVCAVVDPGIERAYVGPCGAETDAGRCARDLYARLDRKEMSCPGCGARWNVAERREWLQSQVDDQLATQAEITRAMPTLLGERLADSTVRWWARTGKLRQYPPHPRDGRRRPRYRVGDVITLALVPAPALPHEEDTMSEPVPVKATAVYDVTVDGTTVRQTVYADGYTALMDLRDGLDAAGRPIMTVTYVGPEEPAEPGPADTPDPS